MIKLATHKALSALADGINKAAAKVLPQREVDVFPHRVWATGRTWWHLDAYLSAAPESAWRAFHLEFGGWTIDASWKAHTGLTA